MVDTLFEKSSIVMHNVNRYGYYIPDDANMHCVRDKASSPWLMSRTRSDRGSQTGGASRGPGWPDLLPYSFHYLVVLRCDFFEQ